jgi:pimeloyl-ACP methyl ester carboxylesterase
VAETVTIRTGDGRVLAFCEWGDPEGRPVWYLHGAPGSRLLRPADIDIAGLGIRLLTYDRPGYGRSDRHPGRSVADAAADVRAIADHLSMADFAVVGVSGGGPHALAVAAVDRDRVNRCASINGLGPPDAADLHFFGGMDPAEVAEWEAMTGPDPDLAGITRGTLDWVDGLTAGSDHPATVTNVLVDAITEAVARGAEGVVDDYRALARPWGFAVTQVACETTVLAAEDDRNVPPTHGRWLADHLARPVFRSVAGGHFDPRPAEIQRTLTWAAGAI